MTAIPDTCVVTDNNVELVMPHLYTMGFRAKHFNGDEMFGTNEEGQWNTRYGEAQVKEGKFISGDIVMPNGWSLCIFKDTEWYVYNQDRSLRLSSDGIYHWSEIGLYIHSKGLCLDMEQDALCFKIISEIYTNKVPIRCKFDEFMYNRLRIMLLIYDNIWMYGTKERVTA